MEILPGLREEYIRRFLAACGRIVSTRQLERLQVQITAVSPEGRLLRGILDQKSRIYRELLQHYETPFIVELPQDHPEDGEAIRYSVRLPRTKRVIALRYEEQTPSTSSDIKPKTKRIRTAAQLLGEKEDFCCRTCFKRFSRKFNMDRHEETCTTKRILYQCPVCHRKYQKGSYFASHIQMHEAEERRVAGANQLAIEPKNVEEVRRRAEESLKRLKVPYEHGGLL